MIPSGNTHLLQRFRIQISTPVDPKLWIEPMGDRIRVEVGKIYEICFEAHLPEKPNDMPMIAVESNEVTVHGWVQSVYLVNPKGVRIPVWPEDLANVD